MIGKPPAAATGCIIIAAAASRGKKVVVKGFIVSFGRGICYWSWFVSCYFLNGLGAVDRGL